MSSTLSKLLPTLSEISGFSEVLAIYEKNKGKPWSEWLTFVNLFPRPGKQGYVGIFSLKEKPEKTIVFKFSQYINHLAEHEYTVMNSLSKIADYCPHFCRSIGMISAMIDKDADNPFNPVSKYPVEKQVLLLEHLEGAYKYYNYIRKGKEECIFSILKQTLLALAIAQRKKSFTHYDIHSNNIMVKNCSKDLVILYVLDAENQLCIPTYGHYPIIIDYGFSYSADMNKGPCWCTFNHTDAGFTSDRFDPVADPKLFLITVSGEINEALHSKKSRKLRNIVKNNYKKLNLDWSSGWDMDTKKCATDYVLELVSKNSKSTIMREYEYYCMELIMTLIELPLETQPIDDIKKAYEVFTEEFSKIENEIGSPYYCIYILQGIVDSCRIVRADYSTSTTRDYAVNFFRFSVRERVDSIATFSTLKGLHYEKMLCSLLCLARCIEGVLYQVMTTVSQKKRESYRKLPLKRPEEVAIALEINIPDDTYTFSDKTQVMVVDCIKESCDMVQLSKEQACYISEYDTIYRGVELYKILNNTS
jgi:hypothetical protein